MTKSRKISFPEVKTDVVTFDGGLNESVSSLEIKPGELILCKNYYITEGSTGGYVSIPGYERFSGMTKPSSVPATLLDHTDRDAARAAILEVPGVGVALASYTFNEKTYGFRNKVEGLTAGMYESTPTGWVEIDTSAAPIAPSGKYNFTEYNFGGTIGLVLLWTDTVSKARMFNGTTVTVLNNVGMGANDTPEFVAATWDRVFLTYENGSIQSSTVEDPTDWTTGPKEVLVGFAVTSIQAMVGDTIVVTGHNNIKVLKRSDTGTEWFLENFSNVIGAQPYTVQKLFDTLIFMSDMGITTLSATQEFGDFASASISERVKNTLIKNKSKITCSTVVRNLNQYRLYFDSGKFLVFSFYNKKLRGITLGQYPKPVLTVQDGHDSADNSIVFFTSTDGYISQMDSGTSFDGQEIDTRLSTAYYHYKSPRNWKKIQQITLEVASIDDLTFGIRPSFDYAAKGTTKAAEEEFDIPGAGSVWGEGLWGTMTWSGSETTNRRMFRVNGIGSNMSVSLFTETAFNRQHTLQNMIVDYVIIGRQM